MFSKIKRKDLSASKERLLEVLEENRDKLHINDDGMVIIDRNNKQVKAELARQFEQFKKIRTVNGD